MVRSRFIHARRASNPHEFGTHHAASRRTPYQGSVDFREPFWGMDVDIVGDETGSCRLMAL